MKYLGDFGLSKTIRTFFNTKDSSGAPITLAGTPIVKVYKDSSTTTETTTGVTLSVDHDGVTGMHLAVVDCSADGAFYTAGSAFSIVLTAGTVSGISQAGTILAQFSIKARLTVEEIQAAVAASLTSAAATVAALQAGVVSSLTAESTTLTEIRQEMDTNSTQLAKLGTPVALDGGAATLAGMLTKMADDNGGADFDATTASLKKLPLEIISNLSSSATTVAAIRTEMDTNSTKLNMATGDIADDVMTHLTAGATTAAAIRTEMDDNSAKLAAIVEDTGTTLPATLTSMSGATFDTSTDSLEAIRNRGDAAWTSGTAQAITYAPTSIVFVIGNDESPGGETVTSLAAHDDVYVQCGENATTGLEFEVLATLTGKQTENPTAVRISALYNGAAAHELSIEVWNYRSSQYEHVATMKTRTTFFDYVIPLDSDDHDPANGSMKIRFKHNTATYNASHYLRVDYISFEKRAVTDALAADVAQILSTVSDIDLEVDDIGAVTAALKDMTTGSNMVEFKATALALAPDTTVVTLANGAHGGGSAVITTSAGPVATETVAGALQSAIGTPVALDGGAATVAGMLVKMADDNGGADFDATNDSMHALQSAVTPGIPQPVAAEMNVQTTGSLISGTYSNTLVDDDSYWITAPVTPAVGGFGLSVYLRYDLGKRLPNTVTIRGHFDSGTGRYVDVYAWNAGTTTWDILSNAATRLNNVIYDELHTFSLSTDHVDPTTGLCFISFRSTSTTTGDRLYIDQCHVNAAEAGASATQISEALYNKLKYALYDGAIWIDTVSGYAGTDLGINGLPTYPVDTLASALTLANSLGVRKLRLLHGSSITLTASVAAWVIEGHGTVDLGNQGIADAQFIDCHITGTSTGSGARFINCEIGDITVSPSIFFNCGFGGVISALTSGDYVARGSMSSRPAAGVPGAVTPQFIFVAGANLALRGYSGGIRLLSMVSGNRAVIEGNGRVILDSTVAGGTLHVRGGFTLTDEIPGGFAGTLVDTSRYAEDQNVASVVSVGSGAITNTSFAANALRAAAVHDDVVTKVQAGLSTSTEVGGVSTQISNLADDVAEIPTAAENRTEMDDHSTKLASFDERIPSALVNGHMSSHVDEMANNTLTSAAIADGAITYQKIQGFSLAYTPDYPDSITYFTVGVTAGKINVVTMHSGVILSYQYDAQGQWIGVLQI